jgi:hypothetical protein
MPRVRSSEIWLEELVNGGGYGKKEAFYRLF